jgi:hypothetical protein
MSEDWVDQEANIDLIHALGAGNVAENLAQRLVTLAEGGDQIATGALQDFEKFLTTGDQQAMHRLRGAVEIVLRDTPEPLGQKVVGHVARADGESDTEKKARALAALKQWLAHFQTEKTGR